jgi:hypothetical protein
VAALTLKVLPDGAQVRVDDDIVGTTPLRRDLYLEAGRHRVEARMAGYQPVSREIRSVRGGQQELMLELVPDAGAGAGGAGAAADAESEGAGPVGSSSPAAHDGGSSGASWAPVIVGGAVSTVALVSGVALSLSAASDRDEMRRLREQNGASGCSDGSAGPEPCRAQRDAAKSTQRKTNMATAGYAVAGVALAATVGYWLWAQPGSTPNQAGLAGARLDAAVDSDGATVWFSGQF